MLNILYLGDCSPGCTSLHRADALLRVGHSVVKFDPYKEFAGSIQTRIPGFLHHKTGFRFLQSKVIRWLNEVVIRTSPKPDLVWIDSGELFGPSCIRVLKTLHCPVIVYNIDDPTGKRDGHKFDSLIKAMPLLDLIVVVRRETEAECWKLGAKRVLRISRSYDEVAHQPFRDRNEIPEQFRSEVVFCGTWMNGEKRDEFIADLIDQGVPVSIWGDRWEKSKNISKLKPFWRGKTLRDREYVAAVQGAKICLGFLSKGNRDLHTTRSLEIPYSGGLFCAKRTTEHEEFYKDGVEAVFWSDTTECARLCKKLLADDSLRESIVKAGMIRVKALKVGNEDICKAILDKVFENH